MNTKISAEAKLEQCGKDVVRHYVKLQLCNVVTTLALCWEIAEPSLLNFAIWRQQNFHFQRTDIVDTTNCPTLWHCPDNAFVFGGMPIILFFP